MTEYQTAIGASDEWYTPPYIFEALDGRFDCDVASPGCHKVPWIPARAHFTSNSLDQDWFGCVWMNAPFGRRNGLLPWLEKFIAHGNGIALTPDRTSAPWWQVACRASDGVLFVSPKTKFIDADGNEGKQPGNGVTLFAIGHQGMNMLRNADGLIGTMMLPWREARNFDATPPESPEEPHL